MLVCLEVAGALGDADRALIAAVPRVAGSGLLQIILQAPRTRVDRTEYLDLKLSLILPILNDNLSR